MSEPINAGDRCEVVWGLQGENSPNLGLIVIARQYVGDHSQHGRVWRCEAEYAEIGQPGHDVPGRLPIRGMADFAQAWLRKLPPPPPEAAHRDVALTASA